jgi:predicted ATPase/class 3 adenylate cyclase
MTVVRADLPSGTVTFLFTDVEGSTRLLHELGAETYAEVLVQHRRLLREAFSAQGGVEVDTQGDSFFYVFPTAPDAVAAAAAGQSALSSGSIRVRMGLHTGAPHLTEEGYVGEDVHRAARIAACAHGGQVVLSAATASLVRGDSLRDLGEHRLKDLSTPERLYQLGEGEFPPLRSLYRTNLPVPSTPFFGRERELAEVLGLLDQPEVRLLTLTGPGGCGKTRLALQACGLGSGEFPDGVYWLPLAALRDPRLVLEATAAALDARGELASHIGGRRLLLFFDNFEHLLEAAAGIAGLLARCPNLRVVVTSRQPLRLTGEQEYQVPPFAHREGVDFFLAHARAIDPGFEEDGAVSEICRRLDDLPLALELAAARLKALTASQLLGRLQDRLPLLTGGARDLPERQRTLRATLEWSHDLLKREEQRLFARLAGFAGGCTLEAAEEVAEADLDTLQSLIDKSLLRRTGRRFWMLETVREFASERLAASGEEAQIGRQHAEHFLRLAERSEPELFSGDQTSAMAWFSGEIDNVRAALDWSLQQDPAVELRLTAAVAHFWLLRGHWTEAGQRLEHALAAAREPPAARTRVLQEAALLARIQRDLPRSQALAEEGLVLCRKHGDRSGAARCLNSLGAAAGFQGDWEAARHLFEEGRQLALAVGDRRTAGFALFGRADVALFLGRLADARRSSRQALELFREIRNHEGVALSLSIIGLSTVEEGEPAQAVQPLREGLSVASDLGFPEPLSWCLDATAALASDPETTARLLGAAEHLREGLPGRPTVEQIHERTSHALQDELTRDRLDLLFAEGRLLLPEQAVQLALDSLE